MLDVQSRASLAPCDTSGRRGGFPTILLAIAVVWLLGMAFLTTQETDARHIAVAFLFAAVLTGLAAWGSWSHRESWDKLGRFTVWFVFGATLSFWIIGIFSVGWLFLPTLLLHLIAIITWPRDHHHPIVTARLIGAEILGFFVGPIGLGLPFLFIAPAG